MAQGQAATVAPDTLPGNFFDSQHAPDTLPGDFFEKKNAVAKPAKWAEYAKPGPYTTSLKPNEEQQFKGWVKQNNIPFENDSPTSDYDMRGFWQAQQSGDPNAKRGANLHFPDTFKTPYHDTFSNESKYALPTAGHWEGDDQFVPPMVANRPSQTAPVPQPWERADSPLGKLAQGQEAETLGNADVAREWWKRGPAELGSGVKGFTSHGPDSEGPHPYARSFNRMVSGAGVTALPAVANLLPMAAVEAPAATALSFGTGAAAQTGVEKGGELLGADPEVAKAAGNVAGIVGASLGPKLPDVPGAVQIAKEDLGRAARVEPTVDTATTRGTLDRPKSVSTLKPGVKAVASLGKLVGGPEVANALIPEHPAQIGPFSRIPDRIPEAPDPVAEAVRSHTASWIPTKVPEAPSTSLTESPYYNDIAAARAAAREDASNALINRPGWVAKLPARVGSGEGGTQGGPVNLIPEPRETVPSDRPGSMWSIKRSKQLPSAAQRGTPGAGEVLQNIGKPVLYTPREGVGYPGPRPEQAVPLGAQTPQAPPSPTSNVASVKMFVTKAENAELLAAGYAQSQLDRMPPELQQALLEQVRKRPTR